MINNKINKLESINNKMALIENTINSYTKKELKLICLCLLENLNKCLNKEALK